MLGDLADAALQTIFDLAATSPHLATDRRTTTMASNDTSNVTPLPANEVDFDLDAYLEQKAEATGKPAHEGSFRHMAKEWTFTLPAYADKDWNRKLSELEDDDDAESDDIARHYLGDDQFDAYIDAGGSAISAMTAVGRAIAAEQKKSMTSSGRPTRRSRSSAKRRNK